MHVTNSDGLLRIPVHATSQEETNRRKHDLWYFLTFSLCRPNICAMLQLINRVIIGNWWNIIRVWKSEWVRLSYLCLKSEAVSVYFSSSTFLPLSALDSVLLVKNVSSTRLRCRLSTLSGWSTCHASSLPPTSPHFRCSRTSPTTWLHG